MKYNPFRPNAIVTPGMFSGRIDEINAIERCLHQTRNGNPQHFLIEGERGIGKSSLMLLARAMSHNIDFNDPDKFNFIHLEIELSSDSTHSEIVRAIATEFRTALRQREHLRTLAKDCWEFLTNWKALGVEYKKQEEEFSSSEIVAQLCSSLSGFLKEVGDKTDGILILIDEADKPDPATSHLGEFVKSFTERLLKQGGERVCLGLAGLPNLIDNLKASHESSVRIFHTLPLEALSADEAERVIRLGLEDSEKKNKKKTNITSEALALIAHLAEGYPHFIQQFGFCAFDADTDDNIEEEDVIKGAYQENGAIDQLGRKYFQEMYFDKVGSEDYRKVLAVMAESLDKWVSRQDIINAGIIKESQVNNALTALKSRNIILVNDQRKGEYRLPTRSFATWIKAINEKRKLVEGGAVPDATR